MRVFGCKAFVHISKDERAKLDAKVKECIYLGSPRDELGFRLWDPINMKMVEVEMWCSSKIKKYMISSDLRSQSPK